MSAVTMCPSPVIRTPSSTPKYSAAKKPGLESKAIVGIRGYGVINEPITLRAVKMDIRATRRVF